MKELRTWGINAIITAAIISFFIAVTVDMSNFGLGAFANYLYPPLIGLITIGIFYAISVASNSKTVTIVFMVILSFYNIYAGIALRNTYTPFPF